MSGGHFPFRLSPQAYSRPLPLISAEAELASGEWELKLEEEEKRKRKKEKDQDDDDGEVEKEEEEDKMWESGYVQGIDGLLDDLKYMPSLIANPVVDITSTSFPDFAGLELEYTPAFGPSAHTEHTEHTEITTDASKNVKDGISGAKADLGADSSTAEDMEDEKKRKPKRMRLREPSSSISWVPARSEDRKVNMELEMCDLTSSELWERIQLLIKKQKAMIDVSNKKEFLGVDEGEGEYKKQKQKQGRSEEKGTKTKSKTEKHKHVERDRDCARTRMVTLREYAHVPRLFGGLLDEGPTEAPSPHIKAQECLPGDSIAVSSERISALEHALGLEMSLSRSQSMQHQQSKSNMSISLIERIRRLEGRILELESLCGGSVWPLISRMERLEREAMVAAGDAATSALRRFGVEKGIGGIGRGLNIAMRVGDDGEGGGGGGVGKSVLTNEDDAEMLRFSTATATSIQDKAKDKESKEKEKDENVKIVRAAISKGENGDGDTDAVRHRIAELQAQLLSQYGKGRGLAANLHGCHKI